MKLNNNYIPRIESLLVGKGDLEHLFTLKDFPVYMGCVENPIDDDLFADMEWGICKETGLIQLMKLLPLDILYLSQHNDGIGKIWQEHYQSFAEFVSKYKPQNILEIGGAHDYIFKYYKKYNQNVSWTTVEPNPRIDSPEIRVIKSWFDENFVYDELVDTVIHSHVFEHTYDPVTFIKIIGHFLKEGDKHIFSFPNMKPMLEQKFTNCLNFEHTVFLTEDIVDYLLSKFGFDIIEKKYYGNPHSIFYATKKVSDRKKIDLPKSAYLENKKTFMNYIYYHVSMVENLNQLIEESTSSVYLFGAHIFSQTLISFGLNTDKIVSILDNSEMKQGKRLYGTDFIVESPKVLKNKGRVNVILKAGIYNEEIKKDILENINNEVRFL